MTMATLWKRLAASPTPWGRYRTWVWLGHFSPPPPKGAAPAEIREVARLAMHDALPSPPSPEGRRADEHAAYSALEAARALRRCCEWITMIGEALPTDAAAVIWGWREAVGTAWSVRAVEGDLMAAEALAALWGWDHA